MFMQFKKVLALSCTLIIAATVLEPCAQAGGGGGLALRSGGSFRQRSVVRTRTRGAVVAPAVVQQSYYAQPVVVQQAVRVKQAPVVLQSSYYAQPARAVVYQQQARAVVYQQPAQLQLQQFQQDYCAPPQIQQLPSDYCAPGVQPLVPGY